MKNRAFLPLIEQILMIGIFAMVAAICIGCFTLARNISLKTEMTDNAVILAQNTAEALKRDKALTQIKEEYYNDKLAPSEKSSAYTVISTPIEDGISLLESATIQVFSKDSLLFELKVSWQEDHEE